MINTNTRTYNFFTFGQFNDYGQQILSPDPEGQIKMDIELTSQSVQDNINFYSATYIGITHDKRVNDSFVIQYGEKMLKVLHITASGRALVVYMEEMPE